MCTSVKSMQCFLFFTGLYATTIIAKDLSLRVSNHKLLSLHPALELISTIFILNYNLQKLISFILFFVFFFNAIIPTRAYTFAL